MISWLKDTGCSVWRLPNEEKYCCNSRVDGHGKFACYGKGVFSILKLNHILPINN